MSASIGGDVDDLVVRMLTAAATEWPVGLAIGVLVIVVAAAILIVIVTLAARIAEQARTAEGAVEVLRRQTAELGGISRINDSGVRILHAARALRKVAVGK
jgi:type VI protein secretion system component VasK